MVKKFKSISEIIKKEGLRFYLKGIWIPAEIWFNEELTLEEKILLASIDILDGGEGCHASDKYFSLFLNKGPRQIQNYLKKLKDKKLIEVRNPQSKNRLIYSRMDRLTMKYPIATMKSVSYLVGNGFQTDNIVYKNIYNKDSEIETKDYVKEINEYIKKWKPPSKKTINKFKKEVKEILKK